MQTIKKKKGQLQSVRGPNLTNVSVAVACQLLHWILLLFIFLTATPLLAFLWDLQAQADRPTLRHCSWQELEPSHGKTKSVTLSCGCASASKHEVMIPVLIRCVSALVRTCLSCPLTQRGCEDGILAFRIPAGLFCKKIQGFTGSVVLFIKTNEAARAALSNWTHEAERE